MTEPLENLRAADLQIDVEDVADSNALRLTWRGKSNERNPEKVLGPFFKRVLDVAAERKVTVEMRFHELQHFNSSTITSVIGLIEAARAKTVRLTLTYSGTTKWQRVSFDALRVFSRGDGLLELRAS